MSGVSVVLRVDKVDPARPYVGMQRASEGMMGNMQGQGFTTVCVCVLVLLQPVGDLLCGAGECRLDVRGGE